MGPHDLEDLQEVGVMFRGAFQRGVCLMRASGHTHPQNRIQRWVCDRGMCTEVRGVCRSGRASFHSEMVDGLRCTAKTPAAQAGPGWQGPIITKCPLAQPLLQPFSLLRPTFPLLLCLADGLQGTLPASASDCFRLLFSDESTFVYRYRGVRRDSELQVSGFISAA